MANTLDRTKPYGTIHGDESGRHFEQGGAYFTVDGKQWEAPKAEAEPSEAEKQAAFDARVEEEVAARLKKLAVKPPAAAAGGK